MPHQNSPNTTLEPFQLLSKVLTFPNEDQRDWWHSTGPMLAKMLRDAGYDIHAQYVHLCVHHKCIVPYLGPYPANGQERWMSVLSRFGLPYELSLNCSRSVVRFAFEPIGPLSGTEQDPFNAHVIWECLDMLARLDPSIDLQWFTQFKEDLVLGDDEARFVRERGLDRGQVCTQNKLGLDLDGSRFEVKMYMYPYLKSVATGVPIDQLMFDSVRKVDRGQKLAGPLSILEEYIKSHRNKTLSTRLISCDLVDPSQSRIKIYVAEESVDWEHLEDIWTLGHRRRNPVAMRGLEQLRELWDLINIPEGPSHFRDGYLNLGSEVDERLPLLANFTLSPKERYPAPQIYFHTFGMSDAAVADAVATFCARRGWTEMAESYKANLFSYYPDGDVNEMNYLQSLISFSYRNEKAYLSVYLHTFETGGYRKSWKL
ncbi:putative dimethylallyl tryptophan synthase [Aspergillus clavatus NRRL 1]|uniref:Dimethylallyl tryptophan synthase, putative n=1 Tax=Aspergillus clavatus (strain ATCC 1007 / CBS 513.65 / DSM 816 / NCTC 3887 / NRRL 1 / QM 1276 / 107) TaxID=344612 RepID=A1CRX0_ASPCL|nr:dimethylallyl tryptophan synthase, putative [Aspergillus clavatus NRRL 1]EAW08391.1 dimethylallyl tryptophan synthase, putative [Aspergillus clavatus NRRL 1]